MSKSKSKSNQTHHNGINTDFFFITLHYHITPPKGNSPQNLLSSPAPPPPPMDTDSRLLHYKLQSTDYKTDY